MIRLDTPMLFALGFLTMFTCGGISGVMLAMIPLDIHVSDTYFIVAHIHYVLFGGSLFTIFAGVYYWFPKMTGRMFDERLGKLHFWTTFVFFNATFAPMHIIGVNGMPRRVADYSDQFATWNLVISLASFGLGLSTLIFAYNMVASWRGGARAPANPWRALTLEWQVSSPPPVFNFDQVPTVVGGPYEYGVPGAVHGIFGRRRRRRPRRRRRAPTHSHPPNDLAGGATIMSTILVVANETLSGAKLLEVVKERAAAGGEGTRVIVCVPRNKPKHGNIIYDDFVFDAAKVRIDLARALPARRGHHGDRRHRRPGPVHGDDGRDRRAPSGRDHRVDLPGDGVGLAAARPNRAHRAGLGPAGHARRAGHRRRGHPLPRHAGRGGQDGVRRRAARAR